MRSYDKLIKPYTQDAFVAPAGSHGLANIEGMRLQKRMYSAAAEHVLAGFDRNDPHANDIFEVFRDLQERMYGAAVEQLWDGVDRNHFHGNDILAAFRDLRSGGLQNNAGSIARAIVDNAVANCTGDAAGLEWWFARQVDPVPGTAYGISILESLPRKRAHRYVSVPDAATALYLTAETAQYGNGHILGKKLCPFSVGIYEVSPSGRKAPYHQVWSGGQSLKLPEKVLKDLAARGVNLSGNMTFSEVADTTRAHANVPRSGIRARVARVL